VFPLAKQSLGLCVNGEEERLALVSEATVVFVALVGAFDWPDFKTGEQLSIDKEHPRTSCSSLGRIWVSSSQNLQQLTTFSNFDTTAAANITTQRHDFILS